MISTLLDIAVSKGMIRVTYPTLKFWDLTLLCTSNLVHYMTM